MYRLLAAALVLGLWPITALGDIAGVASVIDGDTLEIHGERIRLYGIDAPESGQMCIAEGREWPSRSPPTIILVPRVGPIGAYQPKPLK